MHPPFKNFNSGASGGRDSGGIYRNITRETTIPDILTQGHYSNIEWSDICRAVWGGDPCATLKLNIVDTVVLTNAEVELFLYTNVDGIVSKKPSSMCVLQRIRDEFCSFQDILQPSPSRRFVAIMQMRNKEPVPVDLESFNSLCMGSTPHDLEVLRCFVPSKGHDTEYVTFRTDYWLDRNARFIMKTERVGISQDISGSKSRVSTANMNRKSNMYMESTCQTIASRIQEGLQCKVVKLSLEYVEDSSGKIWLCGAKECLIATRGKISKRSQSPEDFRVARLSRALQSGFGDDKLRSGSAEGIRDTSPTRPGSIGRHSQERLELRSRRADKPPSDAEVDAVVQAAARRSGSASMRLSPVRQSTQLNESGSLDQLLDTSMLGTSQLEGCQGDFCTFDLSGFEIQDDSALTTAQRKGEISDFRRNLIMADSAIDFEDSMPSNVMSGAVAASSSNMRTLPFRTIIQTRQEMPLVYRLLRKLKKGDARKFKYVTEDNYTDLYTGGKLPSHYYKDVRCCETCFKVYNIVSEARSRAIASIEKSRDAAKLRREGFGSTTDGRSTAHSKRKFTGVDLEDSFLDVNESRMDDSMDDRNEALSTALHAIEGLTKLDVAEIRTLSKPPAAVEVVMEAVMALLVGKTLTFAETRKLLSSGEGFLLMLREFNLENLTDDRLRLVEPYVDNPVFRPENVMPVSLCASKFCAWVLGVVQAARWQRGQGHKRSNLLEPSMTSSSPVRRHGKGKETPSAPAQEMSFMEKLKQKRARKEIEAKITGADTRGDQGHDKRQFNNKGASSSFAQSHKKSAPSMNYMSRSLTEASTENFTQSVVTQSPIATTTKTKAMLHREKVALMASQKRAAERLASHNKSEGNTGASGNAKTFRCYDGITKMPYIVLGNLSLDIVKCNFVVVHDFFDTCDATAIALKPIALRHDGCQIFCFNYPGQSNTVWPRPSQVEKQRGAKEKVINNEWIADRLHELLQHAEESGDFLLTNPFHLVGIGNGVAIAAAFALRWGSDALYKSSLRSLVSINGFLYPDPQLSAILHSAGQIFESTPHTRPDIPVSFWSRYVFSEEYLSRVNPNLALNIYTAVANPITNDGRLKITRGCLQHKDLRNALSPDYIGPRPHSADSDMDSDAPSYRALTIPLIIVQSTEDMLVNAANVDTFLSGRKAKHLWSHQQNVVSNFHMTSVSDANANWVGKLSQGPDDYAKYSLLGRSGLKMLLQSLSDPRGAFVMWTRSGHAIFQENKTAVLDVFDVLASPTESYVGISCRDEVKQVPDEVPRIAELRMPKIDTESNEMVLFEVSLPAASSSRHVTATEDDASIDEDAEDEGEKTEIEAAADLLVESKIDTADQGTKDVEHVASDSHVEEEEMAMKVADDTPTPNLGPTDKDASCEIENSKDDSEEVGEIVLPPSNLLPLPKTSVTVESVPPPISTSKQRPELPSFERTVPPTTIPAEIATVASDISVRLDKESPNAEVFSTPATLVAEVDKRVTSMREAANKEIAAEETKKKEHEERIQRDQAARMKQYEEEDAELLEKLNQELEQRRKERERADRMRRLELQQIEQVLVESGAVEPERDESGNLPIREIADMKYDIPTELPAAFREGKDVVSSLDRMLKDEEEARKRGIMSMEQFEAMKAKMVVAQIDRDQKIRHMEDSEQEAFMSDCAVTIQRVGRGYNGRKRANRLARDREIKRTVLRGTIRFQAVVRGAQGRQRAAMVKRIYLANLLQGASVITIQRVRRGYCARKRFKQIKRIACATNIQRCFRGYIGRMAAEREKKRLHALQQKHNSAMKIQSVWRMKVAKEEFRSMRIHMLAAIEIQRCYRGYLGRKIMKRRREWEAAPAGPERIKLGLKLIEESKVVFERQQEEIDALHRAQERAEARVSHIHSELKESEKELVILERELQEIDQIERDLQNLTHEKDVLVKGIRDAAGMPRSALPGHEDTVMGREPGAFDSAEDSSDVRRKKAEAYALELTIQIKRAEREKKRQELETEFASVFQEVEKKRKALERLEASLSDMEATRERKDREFRRLQKNLMQLLLEQKQELDDLREKGIELETATATSAAAATATAMKAKEHEKQSAAMFSQTEELMKFQFMSMSLSYFSSLNMLKQLRDMNADTTSAAVASAADTAAAAAAAATAANLPSMKKLHLGADDFVALNIQKKKAELEASKAAEKEVVAAKAHPMPSNIRMWTVDDVARWLDTLSLGHYAAAFREATVDGPFLLELREEDLIQVLGVAHKLHVRKIMVSREKLKPLSEQEMVNKEKVEHEEKAEQRRKMQGVPDINTVFSQARNGRLKRLEESLNLGFPVDAEDEKGNTLLLVAAQNSNKRMIEMLVARGAAINHQNAQGNTALHFAMSFDTEGTIAEYLIEHGADDTIENVDGLTPYDGVSAS